MAVSQEIIATRVNMAMFAIDADGGEGLSEAAQQTFDGIFGLLAAGVRGLIGDAEREEAQNTAGFILEEVERRVLAWALEREATRELRRAC